MKKQHSALFLNGDRRCIFLRLDAIHLQASDFLSLSSERFCAVGGWALFVFVKIVGIRSIGIQDSRLDFSLILCYNRLNNQQEFDDEETRMQFLNTDFLESEEIKLVVDRLDKGNPARNWMPTYHFHICDLHGNIMGACNLRIGYTDSLYYGGHIGYRINEEHRGHHYAAKACKLLFSLAKKHDMSYLYIVCNPDNLPSRKTLEYLEGDFLGIVELPEDNDMRINEGETHKCIFKFYL